MLTDKEGLWYRVLKAWYSEVGGGSERGGGRGEGGGGGGGGGGNISSWWQMLCRVREVV